MKQHAKDDFVFKMIFQNSNYSLSTQDSFYCLQVQCSYKVLECSS